MKWTYKRKHCPELPGLPYNVLKLKFSLIDRVADFFFLKKVGLLSISFENCRSLNYTDFVDNIEKNGFRHSIYYNF